MGFRARNRGRRFRYFLHVAFSLRAELQAGRADIGIIPAAAYTQIPELAILPGVAIAARRPVRSILLVSKVPVEKIRSVASGYIFHDIGGADESSV